MLLWRGKLLHLNNNNKYAGFRYMKEDRTWVRYLWPLAYGEGRVLLLGSLGRRAAVLFPIGRYYGRVARRWEVPCRGGYGL